LVELQVLKLIDMKEYQAAIELVTMAWPEDEQRLVHYLTKIATDEPVQKEEFETRERRIIERCTSESFELKNSIEQMLMGYLQTDDDKKRTLEHTFRTVEADSDKLFGQGKPSFIRLNPQATLACMICEVHKETQVSIWNFYEGKILMEHHWKLEHFGDVQSISWNADGKKIAFCSYNKIASYEATKISEPIVVSSKTLINNAKLLCCRWHPEGMVFFGGLFDFIFGVNSSG
jgi:hypothetical protein